MDTQVVFDVGTKCLFNVHTPVTVVDTDGDFRLIEWTAEIGQKMNYAAHISRLLPIDAPQFTYTRALNKHKLAICDDCNRASIIETFCYDCGACAKCCQCEEDDYFDEMDCDDGDCDDLDEYGDFILKGDGGISDQSIDYMDIDTHGLYDDDGICPRCGYDHCECD